MRSRFCAFLALALVIGQAAATTTAVLPMRRRSLLAYVDSNTVAASGIDGNTVGTVVDLSCDCGYASGFRASTNSTSSTLMDLAVICTNDATSSTNTVYRSGEDGSGASWANVVLDGTNSAAGSPGYTAVTIAVSASDVTEFGATSGTDLTCSSGVITGLHVETNSYGNVIRLTASCATPSDYACDNTTPVEATCTQSGTTGTYYDASTNTCEQCPAGTYLNSTVGDADNLGVDWFCYPCPAGTYRNSAGGYTSDACTACDTANGYYTPEQGASECQLAPLGSYATSTTGYTFCPAGTVGNAARTACVNCPSGYWRPGGLASPTNNVCLRVPAGWRVSSEADTSGHTGGYALALCPSGTISYWPDETNVLSNWTAGATASTGRVPTQQNLCEACTGSTFSVRTGATDCLKCKAGFEPSTTTPADSSIINGLGSTVSAGNVQTGCTACAARYYKLADAADPMCQACPAGSETRADSGAQDCTQCPAGYVNPAKGEARIDSTYADPAIYVDGDFSAETGEGIDIGRAIQCQPCPKNTYQDQDGQTQCLLCPAGQGTDDVGNTGCNPCAVGSYSASSLSECQLADAGYYVSSTGATGQQACDYGTFSNSPGADSCDKCPAGSYTDQTGSKACTQCSAGTYSGPGAKNCKPCPAGTYSKKGARSCIPCPPGTFNTKSGQGSCVKAPAGTFAAGKGNTGYKSCPKGQYSAKLGQATCKKCQPNKYQPLPGKTSCLSCCPVGSTYGVDCFLWTRGQAGAASCVSSRARRL